MLELSISMEVDSIEAIKLVKSLETENICDTTQEIANHITVCGSDLDKNIRKLNLLVSPHVTQNRFILKELIFNDTKIYISTKTSKVLGFIKNRKIYDIDKLNQLQVDHLTSREYFINKLLS